MTLLTTSQVAKYFGVERTTVTRWLTDADGCPQPIRDGYGARAPMLWDLEALIYWRAHRTIKRTKPIQRPPAPHPDFRFWKRTRYVDRWYQGTPCLEYTEDVNAPYPSFYANGGQIRAYRYAWERIVGPVEDGLELDHLCRNPRCVNFRHLEPVTHTVNTLRGISPLANNARKTHCKRGHEFTPENTIIVQTPTSIGVGRLCKICKYAQIKRSKQRRKERDQQDRQLKDAG